MASQGPSTRIQYAAPPPPPPADNPLDLTTLLLSAIASAAAAYVTSQIWAKGTLISAAISPVIVAMVKEGLRRPTEAVTAAVPTRRGRVVSRTEPLPEDLAPHLDAGAPPPYPPPQPGAVEGPVRVYSTQSRLRRHRWRIAVITGLLGFLVCVVVFTVPELVSGQSVGNSGRATTLWGGKSSHHRSTSTPAQTTTTQTQAQPQSSTSTPATPATPQQTPSSSTPPAQQTPTTPQPTPPAQTTPAPEQPPAQTTP